MERELKMNFEEKLKELLDRRIEYKINHVVSELKRRIWKLEVEKIVEDKNPESMWIKFDYENPNWPDGKALIVRRKIGGEWWYEVIVSVPDFFPFSLHSFIVLEDIK